MSDTSQDRRDDVQHLLDAIEDGDWVVTDYDPTIHPDEELAVTIEVARRPDVKIVDGPESPQRDRPSTVKALIERYEADYAEGAPLQTVLDRATEAGMPEPAVREEIERLKQAGELYEPVEGLLRTT